MNELFPTEPQDTEVGDSTSIAQDSETSSKKRSKRKIAPFPPTPFEEAVTLGNAIQEHGAGQPIRRLTLFKALDRSPGSSTSRDLITNSARYGITNGNYHSEILELTELGIKATGPDIDARTKIKSKFLLSISNIDPFLQAYNQYKNKRLPSTEAMRDFFEGIGIDKTFRDQALDIFLANANYVGILRTIAGSEHLIPIEQVIEELEGSAKVQPLQKIKQDEPIAIPDIKGKDWSKICFVIAPIGDEGTEQRKHSDMVLSTLIERALEKEDIQIIRADKITDPGLITGQVIEHLMKSGLVIADLSFHNPNVFYELAIRHFSGLPTVHIIRKCDSIPFDVKDFRTIVINTDDKYELVAQLDLYRSEISNHVRISRSSGGGRNPISLFKSSK